MDAKWDKPWVYGVMAFIGAAYDVVAFLGLPSSSLGRAGEAAAFLVFGLSLVRIVVLQHKELVTLRHPKLTFAVAATETLQRDPALHAIYRRIAVTNESEAVAENCHLSIESWSFLMNGLSADTALGVKDEPGVKQTNIVPGDTKQFDLFITRLEFGSSRAVATVVGAPNAPEVSSTGEQGCVMILRLTGENLKQPRRYKMLLVVAEHNVRINRIDELENL